MGEPRLRPTDWRAVERFWRAMMQAYRRGEEDSSEALSDRLGGPMLPACAHLR
ncbi:MAG: hypothetical protein AB8I08_13775 [Sandaracinaceae bacterium]